MKVDSAVIERDSTGKGRGCAFVTIRWSKFHLCNPGLKRDKDPAVQDVVETPYQYYERAVGVRSPNLRRGGSQSASELRSNCSGALPQGVLQLDRPRLHGLVRAVDPRGVLQNMRCQVPHL